MWQRTDLDINDVQLIIQCEAPRDVEDYIHRSGLSGRAGNSGVAVMLYDPRMSNFSKIELESGVKFEYISAPQPLNVAKAVVGHDATKISDSVIPAFKPVAKELLNTSGLSAVDLLAKALAKAAGYTEIKKSQYFSRLESPFIHRHTQLSLVSLCSKPLCLMFLCFIFTGGYKH